MRGSVHANALFVPAALLQPPFYRPAAAGSGAASAPGPGPRDYGALGGLMGHEVRHLSPCLNFVVLKALGVLFMIRFMISIFIKTRIRLF